MYERYYSTVLDEHAKCLTDKDEEVTQDISKVVQKVQKEKTFKQASLQATLKNSPDTTDLFT